MGAGLRPTLKCVELPPDPKVCTQCPTRRKRAEKKCPRFVDALEDLLRDTIAGDPMTGLKWTHKSIRKLCDALRKQRLPCGHGAFPACCTIKSSLCAPTASAWHGPTTLSVTASFVTWRSCGGGT